MKLTDVPLMTSHWKAEGKIEYTALLYTPTLRPFDLYDPQRAHAVRLYVKRVFITDNCEGLIYPWLRFLRGVVDSEDLPLNISRETLQALRAQGEDLLNRLTERPPLTVREGGMIRPGVYPELDELVQQQ
mgnify:CR=1 FL=1